MGTGIVRTRLKGGCTRLKAGSLGALLMAGSLSSGLALAQAADQPPADGSAGPAPDTLSAAISQTLDNNPDVRFEARSMQALSAEIDQAKGGYYPSVDLNASVGRAKRQYDNRGSYDRQYAELSVTQMLFDGFDVSSRVDEAQYQVREQYYNLLAEAEDKGLEVTQAYLEVRLYRKLVKLARDNVERHIAVLDQVRERAQQGVSNRADLNQADGRLALARSNLRTEQRNLQSVTARFQRLVGDVPADTLSEVSLDSEPDTVEQALQSTFAANPQLQSRFENISAAHASLDTARSRNYPELELGLRQGIYRNNNSFDERTHPGDHGRDGLIELRASYNLFRGGSDRAAQRAAGKRIEQAETLRDKACVDLRQTTTIAWSNLNNVKSNLVSLKNHRQASERALKAYREQFKIGRRSLLDVLDAENESFQSSRNLINGRYNVLKHRAQVLHGMGQLLTELDLSPAVADADLPEQGERKRRLPQRYCAAVSDAMVPLE